MKKPEPIMWVSDDYKNNREVLVPLEAEDYQFGIQSLQNFPAQHFNSLIHHMVEWIHYLEAKVEKLEKKQKS